MKINQINYENVLKKGRTTSFGCVGNGELCFLPTFFGSKHRLLAIVKATPSIAILRGGDSLDINEGDHLAMTLGTEVIVHDEYTSATVGA